MTVKLKILFVEDVKSDAELIWHEIERNKISFTRVLAENRAAYLESLSTFKPDLIISDYSLPQFDGMTALMLRNELTPLTPFILVTGSVNEEVAVECMKAGADDYILKDNLSRLGPSILNSLKKSKLEEEKINADKELQKSELRLQKAQSIAHVGNWELDLSTKIIWGSDEAIRIYGLEKDAHEFPYDLIKECPLPEYRGILDEALDRLLKYNETYEAEFKIKRKNDGSTRWIYSKAEVVLDYGGEQVKVIGVIQDITDHVSTDEALRESQQLIEGILNAIPVRVFWKDKDLVYLGANAVFAKDAGFTDPKDIIGKNDYQLGWHEQAELYRSDDMQVIETGRSKLLIEESQTTPDGNTITLLTSKIPLRNSSGQISGVLGTYVDITKRKRAEEAIIQERRMLRTLIDNLPDPIYVLDKDCRKVISNKADLINIGNDNETDVLGKTDLELFPGKIGQAGYAIDKKVITTGEPVFDLDEEFINAGGIKRWLLTTKIPLKDNDGKITGLVGIGHDITERKRAEEELINAKDKAEESDRLKTAFLHNISHEIRTPMNAIVGFCALLSQPELDARSRKDYIDVILQSSDHLLAIITDIVDISNIEANLVKVVKNVINVNQIIKSLYNQFLPDAEKKGISMGCEYGLPDSDASIVSDGTKLTEILSNLMSNALKFTDSGEVRLNYTINEDLIEFCIADTGIGIPEEYHKRVFDRFYQIQNSISKLYEGTGLGLSIAKAYVELLGGTMWLKSEQGKGTSFYFTVPYEKPMVKAENVVEKRLSGGFVFPEKKTILVAEDIDSNFKLVQFFLSGINAEIVRAENGKIAVEKFKSNRNIDLILMDIKMPVMDGYTAVRIIRETNTVIPIIAQTAYADDREAAIECGCNGFLSKPFDRHKLLSVLREYI